MSLLETVRRYVAEERAFSVTTVISGPDQVGAKAVIMSDGVVEGSLVASHERSIVADARSLLQSETSGCRGYEGATGAYEVFFDTYNPPPRLVIVGAVQTAQALTRLGRQLGYRVTVTDARAAFATRERFPEADEVLKGWPQDVLPGSGWTTQPMSCC